MRVVYDAKTDTLTIVLAETPIVESDEEKPGVILDYDASGNIVSMEVSGSAHRRLYNGSSKRSYQESSRALLPAT